MTNVFAGIFLEPRSEGPMNSMPSVRPSVHPSLRLFVQIFFRIWIRGPLGMKHDRARIFRKNLVLPKFGKNGEILTKNGFLDYFVGNLND